MSIEQIVRAEMAAWGHNDVDEIISHFADDATFDIGPAWPKVAGREAIYDLLKNFFAGGTCIELEILHLAMWS
jgi:limonene-1,2-epoxide hydrolase